MDDLVKQLIEEVVNGGDPSELIEKVSNNYDPRFARNYPYVPTSRDCCGVCGDEMPERAVDA